jgi:ABC-type nitrate/sulfonate/bicarbonate transport system substrate-binding protein
MAIRACAVCRASKLAPPLHRAVRAGRIPRRRTCIHHGATAPEERDMSTQHTPAPPDTLWFTRCPVPTATGLAYKLGWLSEEFAPDGIQIKTLQDNRDLSAHHYDHQLSTLVREGGNLLAIPARGQGAPSRLIGLTWIDEWQSILVRPGSDIRTPQDLVGKRLALPSFRRDDLAQQRRGRSISRGMSLAGYQGALASVGLTLDAVQLVELSLLPGSIENGTNFEDGIRALKAGQVDGVYVKGASRAQSARQAGVVVGIDLDTLPEKRFRVNNGTPRPITAHEDLIENHFDLLVRFLTQTLRAAEWAKTHLAQTRAILSGETRGDAEAVATAYRDGFHLSLAPDLSTERVELFRQQKNFQLIHGFLDRDFDFDAWIDRRPLEAAKKRLAELESVAA